MAVSNYGSPLDVARIKKDFPILERIVHGKRLVYLDSASSAQKPLAVLDAMQRYYETTHAMSTVAFTRSLRKRPTCTRRRGPRWPLS